MSEESPIFFPRSVDFRDWLEENHNSSDYLWVGYYKKSTGKPSVTWDETVKEALCYGWIDGVRKSRDKESYVIRFTPRKLKSVWSQRNIEYVEKLMAEGRMKREGLEAFAYKDVHSDSGYRASELNAELTIEMVKQFKAIPGAWEFYQEQPDGYRRQVAFWVMSAKRQETRTRRFSILLDDSSMNLRIKQFRR
jgi:uncharacterized protein YdeI (YjbR/CyaY-like superfamily)